MWSAGLVPALDHMCTCPYGILWKPTRLLRPIYEFLNMGREFPALVEPPPDPLLHFVGDVGPKSEALLKGPICLNQYILSEFLSSNALTVAMLFCLDPSNPSG